RAGEAHRVGRASLRDYGGSGAPVLFVPSLINPPFVLDLAPERSLVRWLAAQGHRVLLLDWGTPDATERDCDISQHVAALLLPLARLLETPPVLVGYCLGGTIAVAAACLMPVRGLAMIAAPWHFAGFSKEARGRIAALWQAAEPMCRTMGLVPMEVLQSAFWSLDPARTIAKYEAFAAMAADSAPAKTFVALEDWANGGAPLTYAAGAQMFDFFARDLPGSGDWQVNGTTIDPATLTCPTIDFVSMTDRIVPSASAAGFADRHELHAGHVGMMVGSRAQAQLWAPLADWISRIAAAR
ncbi:MAG: alpha/beta fold hydrolase, partial [Sphingomonas sp.]|nr:alpha/beta fold hydrolase [Sphingomonas sp.]